MLSEELHNLGMPWTAEKSSLRVEMMQTGGEWRIAVSKCAGIKVCGNCSFLF